MPIELLYFGIVATFVTFRLMIMQGGVEDPLLPLENTHLCIPLWK